MCGLKYIEMIEILLLKKLHVLQYYQYTLSQH